MSGATARATAEARTNIALVKYWGKRDAARNLPAAGSLSLTLDGLVTRTTCTFDPSLPGDRLTLGGAPQAGEPLARVSAFLELVRDRAGIRARAAVDSENSFPTASGLASSASAFAALAVAASAAAGLSLSPAELSALARRGSGSAARSIFGGLVEMSAEGDDPHASQILPETAWDLRLVVAVVGGGAPKQVSSRSGMDHTSATSPLYPAWIGCVAGDLAAARAAIASRDLQALGEVAERSALTMHATAMAARPGVVYFRGATIEAVHAVRDLRREGVGAWATIDAGPHVKVLCAPADAARVAEALAAVPGVTRVIPCRPGAGATRVA
jgi:diphosphomevalonate decarboxylase